jgi:hypothetical protein
MWLFINGKQMSNAHRREAVASHVTNLKKGDVVVIKAKNGLGYYCE